MAHLAQAQFTVENGAQQIFTDAGLAIGTPLLTLDGDLPVEFILPGDRVVTRNGMRRVVQIEVTRVENARVVVISCNSMGLGRPADEMMVAPSQPILIHDWRAKALYGQTEALIPAARLCDGEFIRTEIVSEMRFVTLRFDEPEVIYAGGLELGCAPVPASVPA